MEREAYLLDIDTVKKNGEVAVRLFCKTSSGNTLLAEDTGFRPYLYAVTEQPEKLEDEIQETDISDRDGEKIEVKPLETEVFSDGDSEVKTLKIETSDPTDLSDLRYEIEHMEACEECREWDITFYRRYLIDHQIRPTEEMILKGEESGEKHGFDEAMEVESIEAGGDGEADLSILAFDLEVIDEEVIMASLASEEDRRLICTEEIDSEYAEVVKDEKELLERFREYVNERDFDVITGYNTDEYDFRRLRERFQHHGMELKVARNGERMKFRRRGRFSGAHVKGRMHLDLYPFVEHVVSPGLDSETLDLDSVAEEILGENKEDVSFSQMKEWWREKENLEEFGSYAMKDADLALRLSEELVPQILELSRLTGLVPFDACRLTYGQLTENFLLREAKKRDILAPNRPMHDEQERRRSQGAYEGGFVYTPEEGLYEDISVFDFRSLYPTVMVAHNISPDTLDAENCSEVFSPEEFDFYFCQDEQGFFPELIEDLVSSRYDLKDEMKQKDEDSQEYERLYNRQQAQKVLANAFYGYLGYTGARWYSKNCAQATTYMGRKYIEETIEEARSSGFEIVYGDTDSVFLRGKDIQENREEFLEKVNGKLPEFMELEFEGHFKRGFFTSKKGGEGAKKKYALLGETGEMKITGFAQVRRDWSPVAKNLQKEVLRAVLEDRVEDAAEKVSETTEKLKNQEYEASDLGIFTTLTKPPEEYDSTSPHVEAARKAERRGDEIEPETTLEYVITRGGGSISDRAELVKYAESYDPDYYIDNQVVPAALRVLKVFDYTEGQLKGKGKQSGLGKFS